MQGKSRGGCRRRTSPCFIAKGKYFLLEVTKAESDSISSIFYYFFILTIQSMNTRRFMGIRRWLAAVGVLSILSSLVVVAPIASAYSGKDATSAGFGWAAASVDEACEKGLVDCDLADPMFGQQVNRATAYQMLTAGFGVLNENAASPFADMPSDGQFSWANNAANTAYTLGWTAGAGMNADNEPLFVPAQPMTRAQLATAAAAALGLSDCDASVLNSYTDKAMIPAYAMGPMACMVENKLMVGSNNKLDPMGGANKAQVIVVMNAQVNYAAEKEIDVLEVAAEKLGVDSATVQQALDEGMNVVDGELVAVDGGSNQEENPPSNEEEQTPTGGALSVSLSASNPNGSIIPDGTAFNPLAKYTFTAGSDAVKLTGLTVWKGGFVSDNAVKVSVWANGVRYGSVVQVSSEHTAMIDFGANPINIAAGSSVEVTLAANLLASVNSGTVSLSLAGASAVASNASSVGGAFGAGQSFQITDGASSVAAATIDVRSLRSTTATVDIGQTDYELTRFELNETSSKEDLKVKAITLFNNGSVADEDLKNVKLKDQDGNVIATVASSTSKYVTFVLANPVVVPLGTTRVFGVYVDVMNGATRTAQFTVQNDFDVVLEGAATQAQILVTNKTGGTDSSFPVGDATTGNAGFNHITINEGSLTVSKDNASPSGDVTKGGINVTLGSFKVQAIGEDVELQRVVLDLSGTAGATTGANTGGTLNASDTANYMDCPATATCDLTGSVKLLTAAGKTLLTLSADTAALWNGNNTPGGASNTYSDLSAYHTIKAGQTETLWFVGNLSSSANLGSGETVTPKLAKLYYYKKSSLKYADSASANGNTLTVTTSSMSVSANAEYGNQTVVSGTSNVKLGSFVLRAGSAEGVNITSVGVQIDQSGVASAAATGLTNLKLMKVGVAADGSATETQIGTTQSSVSDSTTVSFSTSGFTVAASTQAIVNVYGDMNSSVGTATLTTSIPANGIAGNAVISTSATNSPATAVALQVISGSTGGTLRVVNAGANPVSNIYVAGTSNNLLGVFQLNASLAEDIFLKELVVRNGLNSADGAIGTLSLSTSTTPGGTETALGTASLIGDSTNPGYATWTFSGNTRPKVPSNGTLYLNVRGNIVSSQQTAVSGLTPQLAVASVKAEGINQIQPIFASSGTGSNSTVDNVTADYDSLCNVTGALTAAATSFALDTCAADRILVGMNIQVDAEDMLVTAVASPGAAPTITVTRGYNGTTAATHLAGAAVEYGPLAATAANNVVLMEADDATFSGELVVGQVVTINSEDMYLVSLASVTGHANLNAAVVDRGVNNSTIATHAANQTVTELTAVQGNLMTVANTKPTFAAAVDSPSGAVLATSSTAILAKFVISAANNPADSALNRVTMNNLDIRMIRSGVNVSSVTLYPAENDLDANFAVSGNFLSQNSLRFAMSGLTNDKNKIDEGTSRTYILRGNVAALASTSSLRMVISSLGTQSTSGLGGTGLGAGDTAPDLDWSDGVTANLYWTKQEVTEVSLNSNAMTSSVAVGTLDTTGPTLAAGGLVFGGTANDVLGDGDTIALTWTEKIDPTSIHADLVAGGTSVSTNGATADVGLAANGALTITNILTVDIDSGAGTAGTYTPTAVLSSNGLTLTITLAGLAGGTATLNTQDFTSASVGLTTTVKDIYGNLQTNAGVVPTGDV